MEYYTLNDGNKMPKVGFGVFQMRDLEVCAQSVTDAINAGYRLIDTAQSYFNEEAVGKGIANAGVAREELFITSKLWLSDAGYDATKKAFEESLRKLSLDYLDLYLIHQPYSDIFGSWRAMEDLQKEGKIKSIGVSNFYDDQLANLALFNEVKPAVNQIEISPWYQQNESVAFMKEFDVQPEAWAPFAEGKHDIFNNPVLKGIAEKYHKGVGQVILRWEIQRDIVVLAKSVHKERIEQNLDVFDFELTNDDLQQIAQIDKKESQFFDHRDPKEIERLANWH